MDSTIILLTIITLLSWGIGSFIDKLATNRIGEKAVFYVTISYFVGVIIYCLLFFKLKSLIHLDRAGTFLSLLAGLISSFGLVGFYMLLARGEASAMVPLTALYPAVTAILAFIFLHESITIPKILGIIFSLIAIYLLSK